MLRGREAAWWKRMAVLLVLCLTLRTAHILRSANYSMEGGMENGVIARNLVDGHGYALELDWASGSMETVHMPPGIPFLLAGLYWLELPNPHLALELFQAVASLIALVCVWLLAERAFSEPVAWIACVLFVADINLSLASTWVNETAFNITCVCLGLCLIVRLDDESRIGTAVLAGIVFAVGALIRPVVLLILAVSLLWYGVRHRDAWRMVVARAAVLVGVLALILSPWTLRNYRVTQRFVPICSNWAINLWLGYNPRAAGSQFDADGQPLRPTGELSRQLKAATSEVEMDRLLADASVQFMKDAPGRALALRPLSFFYFWLDHNYWLAEPPFHPRRVLVIGNCLLVAATWVALLVNCRVPGVARLLLVVMLTIAAFYAFFHADIGNRFRLQIEPLMLIFVAQLLWQGWQLLDRRHPPARPSQSGST